MYPTTVASDRAVAHRSGSSGLAELMEVILDRGLVIDAYVRVSLIGIELITVDARVVVASVDTYLHFAEAVNRLDLRANSSAWNIADLSGLGGEMASDAVNSASDALKDNLPLVGSDSSSDD